MTIQQAIEKAIKEGWRPTFGDEMMHKKYSDHSRIFLDPLFWQSLGKSMGWEPGEEYNGTNYETSHQGEWRWQWHSFIDHLAEEKSVESFFETL